LEVQLGGSTKWGTVSGRGTTNNATAAVVCRSLGFDGGLPRSSSFYGDSPLPTLLSVLCTGREAALSDCHLVLAPVAAESWNDYGVQCEGERAWVGGPGMVK